MGKTVEQDREFLRKIHAHLEIQDFSMAHDVWQALKIGAEPFLHAYHFPADTYRYARKHCKTTPKFLFQEYLDQTFRFMLRCPKCDMQTNSNKVSLFAFVINTQKSTDEFLKTFEEWQRLTKRKPIWATGGEGGK